MLTDFLRSSFVISSPESAFLLSFIMETLWWLQLYHRARSFFLKKKPTSKRVFVLKYPFYSFFPDSDFSLNFVKQFLKENKEQTEKKLQSINASLFNFWFTLLIPPLVHSYSQDTQKILGRYSNAIDHWDSSQILIVFFFVLSHFLSSRDNQTPFFHLLLWFLLFSFFSGSHHFALSISTDTTITVPPPLPRLPYGFVCVPKFTVGRVVEMKKKKGTKSNPRRNRSRKGFEVAWEFRPRLRWRNAPGWKSNMTGSRASILTMPSVLSASFSCGPKTIKPKPTVF